MARYERIYTVGCFDWFHFGHEQILKSLKSRCDTLIVGVHDDASIEQLKDLVPDKHQSIETRMGNVKQIADIVYVIPSVDPTFFLRCVLQDVDTKENACFIRANDMPNFPGREFVENRISVDFVPYTDGISSTMIRQEL